MKLYRTAFLMSIISIVYIRLMKGKSSQIRLKTKNFQIKSKKVA